MWFVALPVYGNNGFGTETELLPEDEAFHFSASLQPNNEVEISWDIADGYYMYKHKMELAVEGGTTMTAPIVLPTGKFKEDALFGNVEVYTGKLFVVFQVADNQKEFTLSAVGQGCNEPVGVCYPPVSHEIVFNANESSESLSNSFSSFGANLLGDSAIPDTANLLGMQSSADTIPQSNTTEEQMAAEVNSVDQLRDLLSSGFEQPDFLDVDEAFKLTVAAVDGESIKASFEVAEGYYLYQEKISFGATDGAKIRDTMLPKGKSKDDPLLGNTIVYDQSFAIPIQLTRADPKARGMTVDVNYQGCADQGICYPPVTKQFALQLPALISTASAQTDLSTTGSSRLLDTGNANSPDKQKKSLTSLLLGALLAGILLTFTPCVLPLIPILSSVIAGQGEQLTRMRGGTLAIIYVLGTAATYAVMGAIAGATGDQLQAYFQNIWAIGILAGIFVVMALSMFGLFELQMPTSIQSRLQSSSSNLRGSFPSVFILGAVSALIVGACVSPVLISFLGIAVSNADPVLGAQIMFVMAIGMGLPLIAMGFGAGYLIPKAGMWMETVKHIFGVMLIGVAIYMLGVLPVVPVLVLWGVYFIILSVYLGATQSLPEQKTGMQLFGKGIGTVLLVWGVACLIGGFYGERDLLRPLPKQFISASSSSSSVVKSSKQHLFTRVASNGELNQQFTTAKNANKYVLLDFYADWCIDCIKMEKTTLQDPNVVSILNQSFVALQVDLTDPNDPKTKAIKKRFNVFGPPAVLVFDDKGEMLADRNFYGFKTVEEFLPHIKI